ncbi:hypothetical protein BJV77DRAFT_268927 [Russula vinacea]|nr:hypothetical protein BJV77DRAFT_268927 [Russula vinacea]
MPETTQRDPERGDNSGDQAQLAPNQQPQPSQAQPNFGDSSGPLFSIYSKTAEEEDNKNAERWKNDADGILIFTGLFSAAVAALLGVTVQDLRPNSQDTSAFYLGNIYEVLADPNATRAPIPSPVAEPPRFSPPRYAVWVNLLWFLSLVMSLSCALWATSLHQWARRYIRVTQPARCSPEKRARMRALFANDVEKMHISWAVEGLPTLLHLSLFLFFGGLVIFLNNVDQEVSFWVGLWIMLFSGVYGFITLLPLIRQESPYYSPFSVLAWFLYAGIQYVTFKVLTSIAYSRCSYQSYCRLRGLMWLYHGWVLGGVEKKAEEMAEEQSSNIDVGILDWTINALGEDHSLEKFIEAVPGFFNSKLVKDLREHLPDDLSRRLHFAFREFLGRTLSSNSVIDKTFSVFRQSLKTF